MSDTLKEGVELDVGTIVARDALAASERTGVRGRASRRGFLTGVAVVAGAVMLPGTGLVTNAFGFPGQPDPIDPVPLDAAQQFAGIPGRNINEKVLNFALILEILEADIYLQALNMASGRPINQPLDADRSQYRRVAGNGDLNPEAAKVAYNYLKLFSYVEAAHRDFLRTAIRSGGGTTVQRNPGGYKFPQTPRNSMSAILTAILPLEETGVRAYLGALRYMTDLDLATVAAGIYSTEARHSAVIQVLLGNSAGPAPLPGDRTVSPDQPSPGAFEYILTPQQVLTAAGAFFA